MSSEVSAEVCDHCGERYYDPETVRYFEKLKHVGLCNRDLW